MWREAFRMRKSCRTQVNVVATRQAVVLEPSGRSMSPCCALLPLTDVFSVLQIIIILRTAGEITLPLVEASGRGANV